jgi:hypothetical protein
MGIHKMPFEMIDDECIIGYGCTCCGTVFAPFKLKNNIPPPPMKGETKEHYMQAVEEYRFFKEYEYRIFREALNLTLSSKATSLRYIKKQ